MADFNPNTPRPLGAETAFVKSRDLSLLAPGDAVALRFKPGAVTLNGLDQFLSSIVGTPGLALEVVNVLQPVVTRTLYRPGSDTGASVTTWVDNGGGAANFGDVDDETQSATYIKYNAALAKGGSAAFAFRGNSANALNGERILGVQVGGALVSVAGYNLNVVGNLVIGGVTYPTTTPPPKITLAYNKTLAASRGLLGKQAAWGDFRFNPATGLPWLVAAVDNIISAANADMFGATVYADSHNIATGLIQIPGVTLAVDHCLENRMIYFHTVNAQTKGWVKQTIVSLLGACSANTWYYFVVSCPWAGTSGAKATVPILDGIQTIAASAATDTTREHRRSYVLKLGWPAGVPQNTGLVALSNSTGAADATAAAVQGVGSMIPALFRVAGSPVNQTQPYGAVLYAAFSTTTTANTGQTRTTPGGGPFAYSGVKFYYEWINPLLRPDEPLVVEVRHGAGASTGGGTLDATATLDPADTVAKPTQPVMVPFDDGSVSLASSTQFFLIIRSAATATRGWKLPMLSTQASFINGTTAAEVNGQSDGGTADSVFVGAATDASADLNIALFPAPTGPASLTATVIPTVEDPAPEGETCDVSVRPPMVWLRWPQSALTTTFGAYLLYRRLVRVPRGPWELIARIEPVGSITATNVEKYWRQFYDLGAQWAADGVLAHEYQVTVVDTLNLESATDIAVATGVVVPPTSSDTWLNCVPEPLFSAPLRVSGGHTGGGAKQVSVFTPLGDDASLLGVPAGIPARTYRLGWVHHHSISEHDALRVPRAAALRGRQMTLLDCRGHRHLGIHTIPDATVDGDPPVLAASCDFNATRPRTEVAPYNVPAQRAYVAASSYYTSTPDANALDPSAVAFTFFVAGELGDAGTYLSKGDIVAAGVGYGIFRQAAGTIRVKVRGASAALTADLVSTGSTDPDKPLRCVIGRYDPAGSGLLTAWLNDEEVTATTVGAAGSVSNAVALVAGATNGGASGFADGYIRAWGLWTRALTDDEMSALARYLLLYPNQRVPTGAQAFYDLADDRCWDGNRTFVADLSGNRRTATHANAVIGVGFPSDVKALDKWGA